MANSISLRKTVADIWLSNLIMQTFLEILVLSGTAFAVTETEKNLIIYLAKRDQSYRGGGVAGFYLNEMPWRCDSTFKDQINFMIAVVDGAIEQTNWNKLDDFSPRVDVYNPLLEDLKRMLGQLDEQDVERSAGPGEWRPPDEYLVCEAHHMLKYQVGSDYHCLFCNRSKGYGEIR